jgi:FMN-dependent NADH-azoreductase
MKVLHIDAGISPGSVTRQLSAAIVAELAEADSNLEITRRDLDAEPIPHLDGRGLATLAENKALQEFLDADVIVIGAPMYNFGIPSQLKAWIDHIAVAGKTFRYTNSGPEGLAGGKRVLVASARGGVYAQGGPMAAFDFQEPYISSVFRFIGIEDVEFVRAEGVALSADHRQAALTQALASAPAVARRAAPALAA